MRICSIVPSATEILFAIGEGDAIVAVSHECDFPPAALAKPKATTTTIDPELMSSVEIDYLVAEAIAGGRSMYHIDIDVLRQARPDLIVTQDLCGVCAVDGGEVQRAAAKLDPVPRVISLAPSTVADVVQTIRLLGEEVGDWAPASRLAAQLQDRIDAVRGAATGLDRPSVLCLEWLDPPWVAGHWMPEIVEIAGGRDVLGITGWPSRRATWAEIAQTQPQVVILMPCGLGVERTLAEIDVLASVPEVTALPAVRNGQVYAVDGSAYFNRPGPRTVDGLELLAGILNPSRMPSGLPPSAWRRVDGLGRRAPESHGV